MPRDSAFANLKNKDACRCVRCHCSRDPHGFADSRLFSENRCVTAVAACAPNTPTHAVTTAIAAVLQFTHPRRSQEDRGQKTGVKRVRSVARPRPRLQHALRIPQPTPSQRLSPPCDNSRIRGDHKRPEARGQVSRGCDLVARPRLHPDQSQRLSPPYCLVARPRPRLHS
jgi:hypothetical protein